MAVDGKTRRRVALRAGGCCEYCRSQLKFSATAFSVEHIVPVSLGGVDTEDNLALACQGCNNHKYTAVESRDPVSGKSVPLFHPREHRWDEHFTWTQDALRIVGLTATGRATVARLQVNREGVVNLRRALVGIDEHPR